jgi:hypothetical protein
MSPTYERLRVVLLRYISDSSTEAMLQVACRKANVAPGELGAPQLEAVLAEISHGIRLFCPPERQAEMMLALAELAE